MSHTNILKIMAMLPPHIFLSQVFTASMSIRMAYKLNCIVAFTGAHYMVFLRVKVNGSISRIWVLYNDDEQPIKFKGFPEVASYMVQANVMPTMVIFEGLAYEDGSIDQSKTYI